MTFIIILYAINSNLSKSNLHYTTFSLKNFSINANSYYGGTITDIKSNTSLSTIFGLGGFQVNNAYCFFSTCMYDLIEDKIVFTIYNTRPSTITVSVYIRLLGFL